MSIKSNKNLTRSSYSGSFKVTHLGTTEKPPKGCISCISLCVSCTSCLKFPNIQHNPVIHDENYAVWQPHCRWTPPLRGTPANIRTWLIFLETRIIDLHFPLMVRISHHSNFSGGLRKMIFSARLRLGCSRSSKVIDFGANRKRVCDFLLVRHSNLGPIILHRFSDIAGFGAHSWPHPYFTLILGVFPLHQIARVGVSPRIKLELIRRNIIFVVFQRYLKLRTHGQTYRQTTYLRFKGLLWHNRALRSMTASCGKNTEPLFLSTWFTQYI